MADIRQPENPYKAPADISHCFEGPPGFWTRLIEAIWPSLRCIRRDAHDWEHSDFIWVRRCRDCGKYENWRA